MRVLINGVSAVAGGGVTYLNNLIEWLPRLAPDDTFIFAIPSRLNPVSHEATTGPLVLRLENEPKNQGSPAPRLHFLPIQAVNQGVAFRVAWENTHLAGLCRSENIDLLFCPANIAPLMPLPVPLVLMVQNVAPFFSRIRRDLFRYEGWQKALHMLLLEWLSKAAIRRADHVLYLSSATRRLLDRRIGPCSGSVLYHGVDLRFAPDLPRPGSAPASPFFLYVSNIYVYKGLEYLIEALHLNQTLPNVVVIGRIFDQGYFRRMQELARERGVDHRLVFQGEVAYTDLPGWYANAAAFVYASWCENCPNILIEALAAGCPLVAMRTGPMPEICGDAAWYAKPFDGASLGQAMKQALVEGVRVENRDRALAQAKKFTWSRAMQILLEAFHSVKRKSS